MANKFITMLQSRRILQLLQNNRTKSAIAKELNVSLNTIKKYIKIFNNSGLSYRELFDLPAVEFTKLIYPPSACETVATRLGNLQSLFPEYVVRLRDTHITREHLWKEYIEINADGYSYSQFCEHLSVYLRQKNVVMHLEHQSGDVLQIDFAGDMLHYINVLTNEKVKCPVLVCTMPFSAFCYVEALPDMSQIQLVGALNRCLEYLGGVPSNILSDNLKQVVNKPDKYEPVFSELMQQFALHYNTSLLSTRVIKPRDKASVERHVSIAYTAIYAVIEQQSYYSLAQLNYAIKKQLDALNNKPMQGKSHSRSQRFLQYEKPALKSLPSEPFEIKYQTSAKVQSNYHVVLGKDWHNYSVPYKYVGKKVSVIYTGNEVEIYFKMQLIACHKRNYMRNGFSTQADHCPDNHKMATILQRYTPDNFIDKAREIGCNCEKYIQAILNREFFSQQNLKSCLGILHLAKYYENERVERACEIALSGTQINYQTVKKILENNKDKSATEQVDNTNVTDKSHSNIRGENFYKDVFNN